ncbi:MAG: hypothetical protein WC738_00450 [Candidatus Omnitrophota bacterium]|jgi:tetratricopeptide (TPR) repeat protein
METKKLAIKIVVVISTIFLMLVIGVGINQKQAKKNKSTAVVMVGPKGGTALFQKELTEAFKYKSFLDKGDELVKEGKIDDAVKEYETAFFLAKIRGAKGLAIFAISNAYEKKRDYVNALKYAIIDRDEYISNWAKAPVVERAIYLDYALKGEYDLAIEHAQKALEEDAELPNVPKGGSPDYIQRLNDLKAAKDYILSLKKN